MNRILSETADLSPLSDLAPALTEMLVTVASDIALVIDGSGVIRSLSLKPGEPIKTTADEWVGQPFVDTVSVDSRDKVADLLNDVASTGASRPRHLNHPSPFGMDIPITYTAVRLGKAGPVLLVGRDMRAVAAIQQRLMRTQQEIERDYWKRRQAETRYRFLFQIAPDPVVMVDPVALEIVDANRVAAKLLSLSSDELVGERVTRFLSTDRSPPVDEFLMRVARAGRSEEAEFRLAGNHGLTRVIATPLDAEGESLVVLRMRPLLKHLGLAVPKPIAEGERKAEALVVTDLAGRIEMVNRAFAETAGLADPGAACGRSIEEWIVVDSGDGRGIAGWVEAVRRDGSCVGAVALANPAGDPTPAQMSATLLSDGPASAVGFVIRRIATQLPGASATGTAAGASAD